MSEIRVGIEADQILVGLVDDTVSVDAAEIEINPRVLLIEGPAGPAGAAGSSAASHIHTQGSAATTWTINHNLGFKPHVSLFSVGGVEFEADVTHTSDNQSVVSLAVATAGSARCS